MDKEVAQQMVKRGGIGLANMLEKQMLQQQSAAVSTQDALKLHPGNTTEALPLKPAAPALPVSQPDAAPALPLQRDGGRS